MEVEREVALPGTLEVIMDGNLLVKAVVEVCVVVLEVLPDVVDINDAESC